MKLLKRNTLLIGIGNEFRNDDAVGLHVARRFKNHLPVDVEVIETSGEGAVLLELWKSSDKVFAVDAVNSGNKPGTIYRFDGLFEKLPIKYFNYSSHAFSITEAIEVGRRLNQLPRQFIIYGIEGKDFKQGIGLSKEVEDAIDMVIQKIDDDISGSK